MAGGSVKKSPVAKTVDVTVPNGIASFCVINAAIYGHVLTCSYHIEAASSIAKGDTLATFDIDGIFIDNMFDEGAATLEYHHNRLKAERNIASGETIRGNLCGIFG